MGLFLLLYYFLVCYIYFFTNIQNDGEIETTKRQNEIENENQEAEVKMPYEASEGGDTDGDTIVYQENQEHNTKTEIVEKEITDSEPEHFYNAIINGHLEIAFNPHKNLYRLKNMVDDGIVEISLNSMATLAYLTTPFVKMYEMGIIDTLSYQTARIHLGGEDWAEIFGAFRCCMIRDACRSIHFSFDTLAELHEYIFQINNFKNTVGQISYSLPCIYSHASVESVRRCRVCGVDDTYV